MDRSAFLTSAGAAVTLTLAPAVARADTPVRAMTLPFDQGGQLYFAQDLGLFRRAAMDVALSTANYGTQIVAAVAGGAIEIGQSNIMSLCAAYERGLPFSLIAAGGVYSSVKPTSMMIVEKNSPLRSAKDLNGKIVAVSGLKSITQVSVLAWADQNGGDSSAIKFVEMPFSEMEAALAAGRIDAALMAEPDATTALAGGRSRFFSKAFDAIGKLFLIGGWFAKNDWIAANPDTVKKFAAVMRETALWANRSSNHQQSAAILEKYTKVAVGSANRIAFGDRIDPALIQPNIDIAAKYGVLKASFPAAKLIASAAA